MKIKQLFLSAILSLPFLLFAQIDGHHCAFDEVRQKMYHENHEEWLNMKIEEEKAKKFAQKYFEQKQQERANGVIKKKSTTPKYIIPVVFHVLHNGGPENISDAQILSAIDRLNECFKGQNPELSTVMDVFIPLTTDLDIEFKLAKRAPNGACFNGITRTKSPETNSGNESSQLSAIINGNDVYNGTWPTEEYLNIFVVNTLSSPGAAAYAYYPSTNPGMNRGVWSRHEYIGSIGTSNASRSGTVVHELGHWFWLAHPWGGKNLVGNDPVPSDCGKEDDGVEDTPETIGNKTCNRGTDSCDEDDAYWAGRGFPTPMPDNVENFMEYSYCFKMFTIGQGDRMESALEYTPWPRYNLWQPANLVKTGVNDPEALCKVDFEANKLIICEGESIVFKDLSYSGQTSWTWTFEGADVTSSGDQNPTVTYSTAGNYSVTLQASDGTNTMTLVKEALITVLPVNGSSLNFTDQFNMSSFPDENWFVFNEESKNDISLNTNAFVSPGQSLRITNTDNRRGNIYEFQTIPLDLSSSENTKISFYFAYARRNSANLDYLNIMGSSNCGKTFNTILTVPNSFLRTSPDISSGYVPTEEEWKRLVIDIPSQYFVSNFILKFSFVSDGGNHIYFDNINVFEEGTLDLNHNENVNYLSFFPNPSNGNDISLSINLTNTSTVAVNVYDVVGKKIQSVNLGMVQGGKHALPLNLNQLSTGTYLFETLINGVTAKKDKMVIN
jgi:hypothetical protein